MATRRVAVLGASGSFGLAFCRLAASANISVLAVSRSGNPPQARWAKNIQWLQADARSADEILPIIAQCDAVVHAIGTLFEDTSYKRLKRGAVDSSYTGTRTTYEEMNRDTVFTLANAAADTPSVKKILFLSAAGAPPLVDVRYITTKREAEHELLAHKEFSTVIFRPGFMYDPGDPLASAVGCATGAILGATSPLRTALRPWLPKDRKIAKPLGCHVVAAAAVNAIVRADVHGIFDVAGIESLARERVNAQG